MTGDAGVVATVLPPATVRRSVPRLAGSARRLPAARRLPPSVYRRRRIVAAVLLLSALFAVRWALGVLGGAPLTASEAGSMPVAELVVQAASARTYVVRPGDSLWSVARRAWPEGDVRPLVDALDQARGGRPLQAGERIHVPDPAGVARGVGAGGR